MENILFGVVMGMIGTAILIFLTQKVCAENKDKKAATGKLVVDLNDYQLPPVLPMLREFKLKRSVEQNGNVLTVTWKYKGNKTYRNFEIDSSLYTAENKIAFANFCKYEEFQFYLKNQGLFPLVKGKKKCLN